MSDDDLIRRGDALRVADEVFDQCENVNGDDRGAFAAAEVGARIAALPAVTVGVKPLVWQPTIDSAGNPHTVTVAYCPVFEKRFFAEEPEDQPHIEAKRAARILAGLEPVPTDGAQAREAALRELIDAYEDIMDYGIVFAKKPQQDRLNAVKEKLKETQ